MRRHYISSSLAAIALASMATACIDYNYDLGKLDTTATVLPGASVPVNNSTDLSMDGILPKDGTIINIDRNNFYQMSFRANGSPTKSVTKRVLETSGVNFDCNFEMSHYDLPYNFENFSLKTSTPLSFSITNPSGEELMLSANVFKNRCIVTSLSGIPVPPGTSIVRVGNDVISSLFTPFDSDLMIRDISLSKPGSKAQGTFDVNATGDEVYDFSISVSSPMEFKAGEGFEFQYTSDLMETVGIIDALKDVGMDPESIEFKASVTNEFPMEISMSASFPDCGAKFSIDKAIAAGAPGKPVTTELTIRISDISRTRDLKSLFLSINAMVPDNYTSVAKLGAGQILKIDIAEISVPNGFNVEL